MSIEQAWGNFFKSEIKSSGFRLFTEEKVSVTSANDTTVQAYIQATPPVKVMLLASGVGSAVFTAGCSCPMGKKAQFCKHVWATLLAVDEKSPDFLSAKRSIEKAETNAAEDPAADSYAEVAKARANEYRKAQYQKSKLQAKEKKRGQAARENAVDPNSFPETVAAALAYFSLNGFPMANGPDTEVIAEAKRKLSRIFHPDRGGTHAEIVELNEMCDVLLGHLER